MSAGRRPSLRYPAGMSALLGVLQLMDAAAQAPALPVVAAGDRPPGEP